MYESGYYPAGAEFDPRAPWNQEDPVMVECDDCDGTGYHFYSYDFVNDIEKECTETEWENLPDTEEEAKALDLVQIKGDKVTCDVCNGEGEVEEEPYEPDYDEYDDEY